uniref:Uncharacterized protein n=1 Tax=Arundo donax TaxID=35708 RepID=A0A0A8Y684_ARUDO
MVLSTKSSPKVKIFVLTQE